MDEKLHSIIAKFRAEKGAFIDILQDMQAAYGYLPEERVQEVSDALGVPVSRFFSLATFYPTFRLEPVCKQHTCACVDTACHVRGASSVVETFERELQAAAGKITEETDRQ